MASPLKLELNLQQMAMMQIAINCWQPHEIKNEIANYLLTHTARELHFDLREKRNQWTSEILDKFYNQVALPASIKHQITYMIVTIGRRLVHWLKHKSRTPMFQHYVDNVHWTSYGTIDEVKIFRTLYTSQEITDTPYMYEEACGLCLKDDAENLWDKLSSERDCIEHRLRPGPCESEENRMENFNTYLMLYDQTLDKNSHLFTKSSVPTNYQEIYDFKQSARVNHFKLSVSAGHEAAARHFFDQLSHSEKSRNTIKLTAILLRRRQQTLNCDTDLSSAYYSKKYSDILIFLIREMWSTQRSGLLKRFAMRILDVLLCDWPWQFLFVPMLKQTYLTFSNYHNLLNMATDRLVYEAQFIRDVEYSQIYQILLEIWDCGSAGFKVKIVEDCFPLLCELSSKIRDMSFLKHVANDPDLAASRERLIEKLKKYFYELFMEQSYDVVDKILREAFSYTDEECANFKRTIDTSDICRYYIFRYEYDNLHKFLLWQFGSETEVDKFRTYVKLNRGWSFLYDIWHWGYSLQSRKLSNFFFQYFVFDEIDKKNLREQMINAENFRELLEFLARRRCQGVETLLECCEFSQEEIDYWKFYFQG